VILESLSSGVRGKRGVRGAKEAEEPSITIHTLLSGSRGYQALIILGHLRDIFGFELTG